MPAGLPIEERHGAAALLSATGGVDTAGSASPTSEPEAAEVPSDAGDAEAWGLSSAGPKYLAKDGALWLQPLHIQRKTKACGETEA